MQVQILLNFFIFVLVSFLACNDYDTQSLLDGDFFSLEISLKVIAPASAVANAPFSVTILAKSKSGDISSSYSGKISLEAIGAGTIETQNSCLFEKGQCDMTVVYEAYLAPGETETIALSAKDSHKGSVNGLSGNISVTGAVQLSTFIIETPVTAAANAEFEITITAQGNDFLTYESFDGSVTLTPSSDAGQLSVTQTGAFTDGVLAVTVNYSKPVSNLIITATESETGASGSSLGIKIGLDSFGLIAVPFDQDKIRLSWQPPPNVSKYKISRYVNAIAGFIELTTATAPLNAYLVNGLNASTQYRLKVEAQTAANEVLAAGEAVASTTAVPGGCTTTISADITADSTWTEANSPYCLTSGAVSGAILTLSPGTVVLVTSGISLSTIAGGGINIEGAADKPVIITSNSATPTIGDWSGITLSNGSQETVFNGDDFFSGVKIRYALIEYAVTALYTLSSLSIDYSVFRHSQRGGFPGGVRINLDAIEKAVVSNSYFFNATSGSNGGSGGAIGVMNSTQTVIKGNVFEQTNAPTVSSCSLGGLGGAIYVSGTSSGTTITENKFISTTGDCQGGAIALFSDNNTVSFNTFTHVVSQTGGAIAINDGAGNSILKNHFEKVSASGSGGCIALIGSLSDNAIISHNNFSGCSADTSGNVLYTEEDSSFTISANWWGAAITDNSACSTNSGFCASTSFDVLLGSTSQVWPLCATEPEDSDCVGAE